MKVECLLLLIWEIKLLENTQGIWLLAAFFVFKEGVVLKNKLYSWFEGELSLEFDSEPRIELLERFFLDVSD